MRKLVLYCFLPMLSAPVLQETIIPLDAYMYEPSDCI